MQRLIMKISLIAVILLGFVVMPSLVFAEEASNGDLSQLAIGAIYTFSDEDGEYEVTILSETEFGLHATHGEEGFDLQGSYTYVDQILTLSAMGEELGRFSIDGTNLILLENESTVTPQEDKVDWADWIKNELIPYVVLAITTISTIIIAVSPILAKVKQASDKFRSATSDVNKTAEEGTANSKKIEAFTEITSKHLSELGEGLISHVKEEGGANSKKIDDFFEQTTKRLSEIGETLIARIDAIDLRVARIEKTATNTESITRIGFGNTAELVQKGYAAEIQKVGKEEDEQ